MNTKVRLYYAAVLLSFKETNRNTYWQITIFMDKSDNTWATALKILITHKAINWVEELGNGIMRRTRIRAYQKILTTLHIWSFV